MNANIVANRWPIPKKISKMRDFAASNYKTSRMLQGEKCEEHLGTLNHDQRSNGSVPSTGKESQ